MGLIKIGRVSGLVYMDHGVSISSLSTSSSFTSSFFVSFASFSSVSSSGFTSVTSGLSLFSSVGSFLLSLSPRFLGQEFTFDVLEWGLVSSSLLLFFSWLSGQSDFSDCEESFLFDLEEAFFSWHVDINDFLLGDGDDLMKIGDFSSEDFGNPEGFFDESLSSLDGNKGLIFTKEKG